MKDELSLLEYCGVCGYKCCAGASGAPRIDSKEKAVLERKGEKNKLIQERGYWIPRKRQITTAGRHEPEEMAGN